MRRALLRSDTQYLTPRHVDLPIGRENQAPQDGDTLIGSGTYKQEMQKFEKTLIKSALKEADENQTAAARKLEISRQHLIRLRKKHGLTGSDVVLHDE